MITLSITEAQHALEALAARALQGESVFIKVEGTNEVLSLRSVPPELPRNYLDECYGPKELAEEEYLAGFAPKGLDT